MDLPGFQVSGAEEPAAEEGGGVPLRGAAPPAGGPPGPRALLSYAMLSQPGDWAQGRSQSPSVTRAGGTRRQAAASRNHWAPVSHGGVIGLTTFHFLTPLVPVNASEPHFLWWVCWFTKCGRPGLNGGGLLLLYQEQTRLWPVLHPILVVVSHFLFSSSHVWRSLPRIEGNAKIIL